MIQLALADHQHATDTDYPLYFGVLGSFRLYQAGRSVPGLSGSKAEGLLAIRTLHYTERFLRETILARLFASRDPLALTRCIKRVDLSLLNRQARDLVARAAQQAAAHLPTMRRSRQQTGVDVDTLALRVQESVGRRSPGESGRRGDLFESECQAGAA